MRKIALILAIITVLLFAVSCTSEKGAGKVAGDTKVIKSQKAPVTRAPEIIPGIDDFDSEGKIILKSTENRYVYKVEGGYLTFTFNNMTGGCNKVMWIKTFGTKEKCAEFVNGELKEIMKGEEYISVLPFEKYVVFTVAFEHPLYGRYLAMDKAGVESDFDESQKQ